MVLLVMPAAQGWACWLATYWPNTLTSKTEIDLYRLYMAKESYVTGMAIRIEFRARYIIQRHE
jgi:hypothetical protein